LQIVLYQQALQEQAAAIKAVTRATAERREALAALEQWRKGYATIAKIALRDRPDLLDDLDIPRRGPRKRAATPESAEPAPAL
jgi:hypothetical protein